MESSTRKAADREPEPRVSDPVRVPDLSMISGASVPPLPSGRERRPLLIRVGRNLRGVFDRLIASSSLVSNAAVLDLRDF